MWNIDGRDYFNRRTTARLLGVSPNTLSNWIGRENRPQPVHIGSLTLYERHELEAFAATYRKPGDAQ
ncbi:helix-turn-helix domain-containing protein [Antribacter gilvus]|uniref:helix-turn-helix domain-containing protein n=1 Tax=Antribacter gilvus TaxID=2304675 RepID=UPI000F7B9FB2|nr:helix-turn-helix domain-containing protein [Antribacter gilvus]